MTKKFEIDNDAVRKLAELLNETGLNEIEYEDDDRRIRVAKGGGAYTSNVMMTPVQTVAQSSESYSSTVSPAKDPSSHTGAVKSPMVGTVYMASEPGAAPFVKVGDQVSVGQTLLIIEAMKVMNPIKAQNGGIVREILVKDAAPVEYDEVLLIIE
jgi:acetyl-CoA carboxylase biotin carboxyl carrier protein